MYSLPNNISKTVKIALSEDIQQGDLTAELIPEEAIANAAVLCRDPATISGAEWFNETFRQIDPNIAIDWSVNDGDTVTANTVLCELSGSAKHILTGERTALNFLQSLSATATETAKYVSAINHTQCKILDTRKTIPGLRDAQKYAVLCGGGKNHRQGLYDGVLIKENHIMAAGSIKNAVKKAQALHPSIPVEVEVESLSELEEALSASPDIIMLDNMSNQMLIEAVNINNRQAKLEASGNVSLATIASIAETGVDYISIGSLTKHIHAIDLSMRFKK